jgi:hypothetical protein
VILDGFNCWVWEKNIVKIPYHYFILFSICSHKYKRLIKDLYFILLYSQIFLRMIIIFSTSSYLQSSHRLYIFKSFLKKLWTRSKMHIVKDKRWRSYLRVVHSFQSTQLV